MQLASSSRLKASGQDPRVYRVAPGRQGLCWLLPVPTQWHLPWSVAMQSDWRVTLEGVLFQKRNPSIRIGLGAVTLRSLPQVLNHGFQTTRKFVSCRNFWSLFAFSCELWHCCSKSCETGPGQSPPGHGMMCDVECAHGAWQSCTRVPMGFAGLRSGVVRMSTQGIVRYKQPFLAPFHPALFYTGSYSIVQAHMKLTMQVKLASNSILLPQPGKCQDYRSEPSCFCFCFFSFSFPLLSLPPFIFAPAFLSFHGVGDDADP